MPKRHAWPLLLVVNVVAWCVLVFYETSNAAKPPDNQPFANAVEQRIEMIQVLRDIHAQLKEQNALLRSGQVKVIAVDPEKPR